MAREIVFIANGVLPITPLPNTALVGHVRMPTP
jgi:hypothetical protein